MSLGIAEMLCEMSCIILSKIGYKTVYKPLGAMHLVSFDMILLIDEICCASDCQWSA